MPPVNRTDAYWEKRSVERIDLVEDGLKPSQKGLLLLYIASRKKVLDELSVIYTRYFGRFDALDTKLTFFQTLSFFKLMRSRGFKRYARRYYRFRITRRQRLQAELYMKIHSLLDRRELAIQTSAHIATYNTAFNRTVYQTSVGVGSLIKHRGVNNRLVNQVLKRKWLGQNYSSRIWGNTDILAHTLSTTLGSELSKGTPKAKISKMFADRFNVSYAYANRLIRTETNFMYSEAESEAYKQMGIDEYVYVATLDVRTSNICRSLDKKRFKVKDRRVGVNCNPMHPNCRSSTRPYVEGYEPETRIARDSNGRNIHVPNMSYNQWARINRVRPIYPDRRPEVERR